MEGGGCQGPVSRFFQILPQSNYKKVEIIQKFGSFGNWAIWQNGDSAQNGVTGVEKQWINSPNYQKEP